MVGQCGDDADAKVVTVEGLPAALEASTEGAVKVLLACPAVGSDLSQELDLLAQIQGTLELTGLKSVFIYAGTPAAEVT